LETHSILYLDDEADNLVAFSAVFRRFYRVFTAQNPEEARDILHKVPVQVVISDQRMPTMSGVEFLATVKDTFPHVIRMILTGYSDMPSIIDAINKGNVYYYITKPWKFDELKVIISKAMEAYELRILNEALLLENMNLKVKTLQLEKEQIFSQYEALKNQINPHFLFNSLNTLASIIPENPELAIRYTTRFSKLYRYVLELGEKSLIPLEQELELMQHYFFLQKIRLGDSFVLHAEIQNTAYTIPPFALQLLLENVVKHNMISASYPMTVYLFMEKDNLIFKNIKQPKMNQEKSTGIGLTNLNKRYTLISGKGILIMDNEEWFSVTLPVFPDA
jgi:LytS/YehU family sensor histidine kinase